jgi:hypothetical protein
LEAENEQPDVNEQQLLTVLKSVTRIRVAKDCFENAPILYESANPKDIDSFKRSMVLAPIMKRYRCACFGSITVMLYQDEELLLTITSQHGELIRTSLWKSDALLAKPSMWAKWLLDRGISQVQDELAEAARSRSMPIDEEQERYGTWVESMPPPLLLFFVSSTRSFDDFDIKSIRQVLRNSALSDTEQILALLKWFGSCINDWDHPPQFEEIPPKLLASYQFQDIIDAVHSCKLDHRQLNGLARLFSHSGFSQQFTEELRLKVPGTTKTVIVEHIKSLNDLHKLRRISQVFGN